MKWDGKGFTEGNSKENLVQFVCAGQTLRDRQNCKCYVDDETDGHDCQGLKNPTDGVRNGFCWQVEALFLKSYSFLKFYDEMVEDRKAENVGV